MHKIFWIPIIIGIGLIILTAMLGFRGTEEVIFLHF
jgi:hypothetical protein